MLENKEVKVRKFETRSQMNAFIEGLNEDAVYLRIEAEELLKGGYVKLCRYYFDFEEGEGWLDHSDQYLCLYGNYTLTYLRERGLGKHKKISKKRKN